MGSGVAKAISTKWPEVKLEYHEFCIGKRPGEMLGKVQVVELKEFHGFKVVINVFWQLNCWHDNICYTRYDALEKAFDEINRICASKKLSHFHTALDVDWSVEIG